MKKRAIVFVGVWLILAAPSVLSGQSKKKKAGLFSKENLVAWCIVPFDNQHRSPAQRVEMLKRLGFTQYAYDWRHEHVASFPDEVRLARESGIRIVAVWMWIDKNSDKVGQLSEDNEKVLTTIKDSGLKTKLWVGFNNNYFGDESEDSKISSALEMLNYIRERGGASIDGIGLYNHGDWFGEPENQVKILKKINDPYFGLIYNFHHGHTQIESFPLLLNKMMPYLWTVNINGMKKDGPMILPVGNGDREMEMLQALQVDGFKGTIGILGHTEDDDVEKVLERNLHGLEKLQKKLQ